VIEQARNVIDRPEFKKANSEQDKLRALYEIIYQRWPRPEEMAADLAFVHGKEIEASTGDTPKAMAEEEAAIKNAKLNKLLTMDEKLLTPEQREKRKVFLAKLEQRKKLFAAKQKQGKGGNFNELVTDPNAEAVDRKPLESWEKLSHALLMTNEASYIN
jgi:hypothetical protein